MTADHSDAIPQVGRRRGQSSASRRAGYAIAILVDALLLFLVQVWPGWHALGILTPAAAAVVPWIDAAFIAGIVVNLLNLIFDRRLLKAVGDLVTTVIGLIAAIVVWDVFPFDFGAQGGGWEVLVRVLLVVAIAGSAIAIVVSLVVIARLLFGGRTARAR
ncbi:hypothetical protein [Leifsonia sp. C5G2]|uniref:hypothetical protein n=1 Tax=Leifsonia sp. C5G2 TaxID=2735269 RepID=UPI0015853D17|nr:hypothetical protein [Leifsonia sp. C5G2]NUU05209.1 hypothetical protein [Leifsonia sp. C5G2]